MVPTDYRLENVCERLIERLEGARRSYADDRRQAWIEFQRIAQRQVQAAIREFREVGLPDHPEVQAHLLREEVMGTFLPRYTKLAIEMNEREEQGHGLGPFAEAQGRVLLFAVAVAFLCVFGRFLRVPLMWPLLFAALLLPFLPDLVNGLQRARYKRRLEAVLEDMQQIQEHHDPWLRKDQLDTETGGKVIELFPGEGDEPPDEAPAAPEDGPPDDSPGAPGDDEE